MRLERRRHQKRNMVSFEQPREQIKPENLSDEILKAAVVNTFERVESDLSPNLLEIDRAERLARFSVLFREQIKNIVDEHRPQSSEDPTIQNKDLVDTIIQRIGGEQLINIYEATLRDSQVGLSKKAA